MEYNVDSSTDTITFPAGTPVRVPPARAVTARVAPAFGPPLFRVRTI
jgi:hypothetical protein